LTPAPESLPPALLKDCALDTLALARILEKPREDDWHFPGPSKMASQNLANCGVAAIISLLRRT
jgi:hypothetical protein